MHLKSDYLITELLHSKVLNKILELIIVMIRSEYECIDIENTSQLVLNKLFSGKL